MHIDGLVTVSGVGRKGVAVVRHPSGGHVLGTPPGHHEGPRPEDGRGASSRVEAIDVGF